MGGSSSRSQPNELIDVVTNVQRALRPVAPPSAFREHLRDSLRMAAEHQLAHPALRIEKHRQSDTAWAWVFGAALVGACVSFIVIQLRVRYAR